MQCTTFHDWIKGGGEACRKAVRMGRRRWRVAPNGACVAFDDLMTGASLLRAVRPEARLVLDGEAAARRGLAWACVEDDAVLDEACRLAARAAATPDHAANTAIQVEIAAAKQQLELDILAIQARHARASGNR